MGKDNCKSGGISVLGLLFVLFVGLKLAGVIDWSWWLVFAPIWGPVAGCIILSVICDLYFLAIGIYKKEKR